MKKVRLSHHEMHKRARELRNQATPAERRLWHYLSGRKINNLRFRRQHLIDHFIVDFYCREKKLVIEIDGGTHLGRQAYDRHREIFLVSRGLKVIRFSNEEVISGTAEVLEKIMQACELKPPSCASPE